MINEPQPPMSDGFPTETGGGPPSRNKNVYTGAELVALAGLVPEIPDGVHDLKIEQVTGDGGRIRLHVTTDKGERSEVPIGSLRDRRTLDKNLRILLGRTDLDSLEETRAALVGKKARLRLRTYSYHGTDYRGVNRP